MSHSTVRAINIPVIVKMISEKLNCSESEALDLFYNSEVGKSYADDETGLFGQSALHIFGLFMEEINYENKMKGKTNKIEFVDAIHESKVGKRMSNCIWKYSKNYNP